MELKKLKDGEVAVTVIYHITEELVNKKFKFIRSVSRSKATDGIPAIYIDDQGRKKPTQSISFAEAGEHIVRIVLEDSTVVPFEILEEAENIYSVEIPESVTTVEIYAFRRAQIACPPVLPPNLKKIEQSAFEGAYKDVETIQLSDSVEFVGRGAFGFGKHLVVGKNYRGGEFNNITIPAENIYLEVRDGFIINRETRRVEAMLPGAFEDTASTTISLPEGITEFDDEYMFDDFHKASIYVPASVEKCRMNLSSLECEPAARTIEFAEGIGEISIICRDSNPGFEFKFPKNATLSLDLEAEHVFIPEGCRLKWCRGSIDRLELGPDVVLNDYFSMGAFADFEGEIFVKGPISFEHWGAMKEGSVIHVPDEETGRKILESPGFYKKIAIYVGDDRPLEAQQEGMADKRLFEILGCPDYDKVLKPVEPGWGGRMPTVVTLLYNLPAKTTVQIDAYCGEYMLDDGDVKKLKKGKISIPKGQHIVRLIDLERIDHEPNNPWDKPCAPVFEPACDAMFIDNDINLHRISKHMKGVRHLILGNGCKVSELLLPVERVSVLAGNPCLEEKEGCIVHSKTGELIFASIDCTGLPSGIKKIQDCALRNYSQERLVIPGSIKNAYLCNRTADFKDKIKEIVFEEGVERVELNNIEMCPEMKVSFPSSMKRLWMPEVTVSSMTVPHDIELTCCSNANIANLVFLGNVALRPGNFDGEVFEDFSGNIRFGGTVTPAIKTVSGEDAPATFFGTTSDNCTITVAHKETADVISACRDFNPNVKITVE